MDAALHDPSWGYYAHHVSIGRRRPLHHQPGVAVPALRQVDRDLGLPLLAGHGRARRAVRDATRSRSSSSAPATGASRATSSTRSRGHSRRSDDRWRTFAARLAYRIYETSASLRDKQRALLGGDAVVAEGDARRPGGDAGAGLPRRRQGPGADQRGPRRVRRPQGRADRRRRGAARRWWSRAWRPPLRAAPGRATLARRIGDADAVGAADLRLARATPAISTSTAATYAAVMEALAGAARPASGRRLRAALWFEEAYVPASAVPGAGGPPRRQRRPVRDRARRRGLRRRAVRERSRRPFHPRARVVARGRVRRHDRLRRHHLGPGPGRAARRVPVPRLRRPAGLRARGPTIPTPRPGRRT